MQEQMMLFAATIVLFHQVCAVIAIPKKACHFHIPLALLAFGLTTHAIASYTSFQLYLTMLGLQVKLFQLSIAWKSNQKVNYEEY